MGVRRGDSGSSCDSAPTEICQGLPYSHGDYLCTFPIVCPVQHYLVWRVFLKVLDHQVTRASSQKREPPQKLGEAPSYSRPQLNLLLSSRSSFSAQSSCPQSSLNPHPHPLVKLSGRMLLVRLEKNHQTLPALNFGQLVNLSLPSNFWEALLNHSWITLHSGQATPFADPVVT